jgi:hypothetical protein
MFKNTATLYAALAVAAVVGVLVVSRNAKAVGQAAGGAAVDLVDGVLKGTVQGVGTAVGVPVTNLTECERAKIEGRTWDASFACPAGDFLKYVFK